MKSLNNRKYLIRYLTILSVLCVIAFTKTSCKKTDVLKKPDTEIVSMPAIATSINKRNFFDIPASTHLYAKRIAEEVKRRNSINEFVTEFGRTKGIPIWEKSLISSYRKPSNGNLTSNGSDTLVYVPIVLQGSIQSNGFVRAVINDSISLSYCLAKDYITYPFTTSIATTNAMQFSTLLMYLDHEVFGSTVFNITDERLFSYGSSTANKKVKLLSVTTTGNSGGNNLVTNEHGLEVCWTVQNELSATGHCSCGSEYVDWMDGCTQCSYTTCVGITIGGGMLGDPPPIGGGTPITGGPSNTGGGGSIPPYYPCNPNLPQPLLPEPLPPCPPTNNNVIGWVPLPVVPTPCQIVDSLMRTNNFPLYYSTLRNSANLNYEKGFMFIDPFSATTTYEEVNGPIDDLSIDINPATPIDGIVHSHYINIEALPIFSFDDIWMLYKTFKNNKIKDIKTFTYGVVTNNTSYIIMIDNQTNFEAFGNNSLGGGDIIFKDLSSSIFYDNFKIESGNSEAINEKNFLYYLQQMKVGVKLFKGNPNMTQFTPIKLNSNLDVVVGDCI